jgi:serine/threonine protein kinase
MGEVHRAHDSKLRRDVAIKVLPVSLATDPERLRRFEREAQVLASLNHTHIAAIYGVEECNNTVGLILELVEGDTLEELLLRGPLALEDALPIARQMANALEAAHEKGIVHRDLKPSNVKVTPDAVCKVLDFGIAKANTGLDVDPSQSPTMAVLTHEGRWSARAAYMPPSRLGEGCRQARGHLGVRLRPLRNAHGRPGVRGGQRRRHDFSRPHVSRTGPVCPSGRRRRYGGSSGDAWRRTFASGGATSAMPALKSTRLWPAHLKRKSPAPRVQRSAT